MNYIQVNITCLPDSEEILHAQLIQIESCLGIEESTDGFVAYFENEDHIEMEIYSLQQTYDFTFQLQSLEHRNWNAYWESNYHPIAVDDYCYVYASFHNKRLGFAHYILINPKMAFGTGHHDTTLLMIKAIRELDCNQKTVLDLGCGTGILGILCRLEGAKEVLAVDIEEHVQYNVRENVEANHVTAITAIHGTIHDVDSSFDVIFANINRNVLLQDAQEIINCLNSGGKLLLSGFYVNDFDRIQNGYEKYGLKLKKKAVQNNWMCLEFIKE